LKSSATDTNKLIKEKSEANKRAWEEDCRKNKEELAKRVSDARNRGYLIDNYDAGGKNATGSLLNRMKNLKSFSDKIDSTK
jgi:hypothetical protein